MLWKVKGQTVEPIQNTKFSEQQLQARDLENWIESNPDILGEPLMFIGRQVVVPGINDRLDLLALDPTGDTVMVEITDPWDAQNTIRALLATAPDTAKGDPHAHAT